VELVGQRAVGVGQQRPVAFGVYFSFCLVGLLFDGGDPAPHVVGGDGRGQPAVGDAVEVGHGFGQRWGRLSSSPPR
jgi:hypothetical protein